VVIVLFRRLKINKIGSHRAISGTRPAARTDPTTVIIARTIALAECPLDEVRERIRAYSDTGAEALMLVGAPGAK
jgi:2-methylisocitrate lyase-like PEP mutase family enzyme